MKLPFNSESCLTFIKSKGKSKKANAAIKRWLDKAEAEMTRAKALEALQAHIMNLTCYGDGYIHFCKKSKTFKASRKKLRIK